MRHKGKIIVGIALMVIGIAIGYYLGYTSKTQKNFDWKELSIDQGGKGYDFTSDALFNSDIALPEIKKLSGKSKFIKAPQSGSNELTLGYIVSVDVDKLDLQKVPQKYKVGKKEKYKAGEFAVQPIEAVVYEVTFEFVLKDKDDFEIINRCGCVPCDNSLRQVFNKPDLCSNYTSELNLSNANKNDK